MSTERPASDNALAMIAMRQLFYLQQVRMIIGAVLLQMLLIASLVGMLVYFLKHPVHPIYFATDKVGRLRIDPPLSQPNMSIDDVMTWAQTAVETAYTYDFINYRHQLQNAENYFTDYGWKNYMKGLESSNNLIALTQRRLIVSAKVVAKPKVLIQGILGSRYAWKLEMPVLVTYMQPPYDDKSRFSNPLLMTVTVARQKLSESENGLGIVQIIANLAVGSPQQNMNVPGA